jgi:hypothetical protein
MVDMGFFFILTLIILFAIWCGLGVSRRQSPAVLWGTSVLTVILVFSTIFFLTKTAKSEGEAIAYGLIFGYLLLALAFTLPLAVISWLLKVGLWVDRTKK